MALLPILIGAVPFAIGAVIALCSNPDEKHEYRLRKTSFTKIGDLREGKVAKVRGTVEAFDAALTTPFSGASSVHYQVVGATWDPIVEQHLRVDLVDASVAFWLVDDTGRLLVRDGPLARLVMQEQCALGAENHSERMDISERFADELGGRPLRYALEASLDVGEEVVVWGKIGGESMVADPATGGYRDARRRVPTLIADPDAERIVSDLPELVAGA